MEKTYIIPHIQIFTVENEDDLLQMSISETELVDNYCLVRENDGIDILTND